MFQGRRKKPDKTTLDFPLQPLAIGSKATYLLLLIENSLKIPILRSQNKNYYRRDCNDNFEVNNIKTKLTK